MFQPKNRLATLATSMAIAAFAFSALHCGSGQKKTGEGAVGDKAFAGGWTIGEGRAQVYQDDVSLAKDRALRDAKKDAIKRKLGEMVKSKTVTDSGVWVSGEVSSKAEGLVSQHKVEKEYRSGDVYHMRIRAHVEEATLKSTIEDLLNDWERPVIFGIVQEKFGKKKRSAYDNATIQALDQFFNEKGFSVNKTSALQKKIKPPVNISKVSALLDKKEPDFDLLLFGSSTCSNAGNIAGSKLISAQADVQVSLFDVTTRRLIATSSKHSAYPHISFQSGCGFAIKKAVKKMNEDLFQQMLNKWNKEYSSGKTIILNISGIQNYNKLYSLENDLRDQIRGVVDVIEKSHRAGKSVLHIVYRGQTKDLAQELVNKKLSVPLTIKSKKGRKIEAIAS